MSWETLPTTYVVLYGERGVSKEFRKLENARKLARLKARQRREPIEIDFVKSYPRGTVGRAEGFDWSQGFRELISPEGKRLGKQAIKKHFDRQIREFNRKRRLKKII